MSVTAPYVGLVARSARIARLGPAGCDARAIRADGVSHPLSLGARLAARGQTSFSLPLPAAACDLIRASDIAPQRDQHSTPKRRSRLIQERLGNAPSK